MPRTVDHQQRRTQIIEALVRVAGSTGLHTVTMRSVAAEAGVSLRLVQYYFESKAQLMHAALLHMERQSNDRWKARLATLAAPPTPRGLIEAFFAEALPIDGPSRVFHLTFMSYAVLAMTDPELAAEPFVDGPNRLERQLAEVLQRAQNEGSLRPGLDPAFEAARLLTINHGLGTSVLVGQRSVEDAQAVQRYHLDQLFIHGRS